MRATAAVLAALLITGCDGPVAEPPNEAFVAVRDAAPEHVFRGTLAGRPVHLVAHDCEVFLVRAVRGTQVDWERVLAPDPYPFFTSCARQSLVAGADGGVTATLGRMAFGAGRCCATGGSWRSRDGATWTKTR